MNSDNQVNSITSFEVILEMVPEHGLKGQEAFCHSLVESVTLFKQRVSVKWCNFKAVSVLLCHSFKGET